MIQVASIGMSPSMHLWVCNGSITPFIGLIGPCDCREGKAFIAFIPLTLPDHPTFCNRTIEANKVWSVFQLSVAKAEYRSRPDGAIRDPRPLAEWLKSSRWGPWGN